MSKPKPGLGKGIVRTLSHAHPNSSSASSSHHGALSTAIGHGHREYITAAATASSSPTTPSGNTPTARRDGKQKEVYPNAIVGPWRDTASFSTIGLPTSVGVGTSNATWSTGSGTGTGPSTSEPFTSAWDGDVVLPFRTSTSRSRLPRKSRVTGRAQFSTTQPTSSVPLGFDAAASPLNLSPLWTSLNVNLLSTFLSLPSLSSKLNSTFSDFFNGGTDPSIGFNTSVPSLIAEPGHRPPPRSTEDFHTALSLDSNATSPTPDSFSEPAFAGLGLPIIEPASSFDPFTLSPMTYEGSGLNLYTSNLIFHLGTAGSAKERPVYAGRPRPQAATPPPRPRSFPLPEVSPPLAAEIRSTAVGEDAYFARMDGMCIADGVGGWARSGKGHADAGRWSRLLTHFCEMEVTDWWAGKGSYAVADASTPPREMPEERRETKATEEPRGWASKAWKSARTESIATTVGAEEAKRRPLDPVEIMQRGYEKCLSCVLSEGINGSSTCLLALLHHSNLLVANLGDCCLLVIRSGQIIFRTDEMQHAFNFPLQVGTHSRDEPMKDAKRYDVSVGRGDVVVVGSDGLMDNLFDEDILDTLSQFAAPSPQSQSQSQSLPTPPSSRPTTPTHGLPPFSPQKVSEALCKRARAMSEETSATTPFMMKAIDEGIDFVGGKKDDISVLVGVIGHRDDSNDLALHTE